MKYKSVIKEQQRRKTFEINFKLLNEFLAEHKRFPKGKEHPKLYSWMAGLMNEHKFKRLPEEYVDKLNAIGFIWSRREANWFEKAERVKEQLIDRKEIPTYDEDTPLYQWLKAQLDYHRNGRLPEDKAAIISEISSIIQDLKNAGVSETVKVSSREIKWCEKYARLKTFREENNKWPVSDSKDANEKELGIWCQDLRSRNRKGTLEVEWKNKLDAIEFNFEGKIYNWRERFDQLRKYVLLNGKLPDTSQDLYNWWRLQHKRFELLNDEQKQLLASIGFAELMQGKLWDQWVEEIRMFIQLNNANPTKKSSPELYSWLTVQRAKFRKGQLSDAEINSLEIIGINLAPTNDREDTWLSKYEAVINFRKLNPDKWPSYFGKGEEKQLYQWCQAQRQVAAGTARNRKELSAERKEKLDAIGFHWSIDELHEKSLHEQYEKLKNFIAANRITVIPIKWEGKTNQCYTWLRNQRIKIEEGKMEEEKLEKLKRLGVV